MKNIILDETIEHEMNEISEKEGISKAEALTKIADEHWDKFVENDKKRIERLKEQGVPVTKRRLQKATRRSHKNTTKKMKEKYQKTPRQTKQTKRLNQQNIPQSVCPF